MKVFITLIVASLSLIVFATMVAIPAHAQKSDRVIVTRPDDPLNRDPVRPNEYEIRIAMTGTPSQLEAALTHGKEAFEAKPQRLADAEQHYLEAAKISPKEGRAYMGLGIVYAGQNRIKDAIEALQKAIELKPKLAAARFNLGVIFCATGRKEEAQEQLLALQTLDKDLAKKLKEMLNAK